MNDFFGHLGHLFQFDGMLHWCFQIAFFAFLAGLGWVILRILIPLRRLARQSTAVLEGRLPTFDDHVSGIGEIEQLRRALQYMIGEIKTAQEREIMYRNALTESQENERKRIAREIHDDTIQSLVLVAHSIERATQSARMNDRHTVEYLDTARADLIGTIESLRQMIANLRPTMIDELGLATAIEVLCEKHQPVEFHVVGEIYTIDPAQELAIFRAAQEAIHNAERHAHAGRITATLTYSEAAVTLEVRDNGIGFHIPRQLQEFSVRGHYGLIGIRERILHLGGHFNLNSQAAFGTRVIISVPTAQSALIAA